MNGYQQTSMAAYRKAQRIRGEAQAQVFRCVRTNGPMTNMEIAEALGWSINRVTPRVLELRHAGFLQKMGVKRCRITNNNCLFWGPKV